MSAKRSLARVRSAPTDISLPDAVLAEVRDLILEARQQTARMVNAALTLLYWRIGDDIRHKILGKRRAEYGAGMVTAQGRQLEQEFGRGFSAKSLHHMIRFAEAFPSIEIVSALLRELSWTHFTALFYLDDPLNIRERRRAFGPTDQRR